VAELAGRKPLIDRVQGWSEADVVKRLQAIEQGG
jgi:hypothetical protein